MGIFGCKTAEEKSMKKTILGSLLAILLAFGFFGCDNPTGGGGEEEQQGTHLIKGSFVSQTGTGNAVFYADYVSSGRSVFRSVGGMASNERELTGRIEDGDIIFNLKGIYNTSDNTFFLSAGSSFLIYQIAGTLTNGNLTNTEAAVKIKEGDDWSVHTVAVSALSSEVEITGNTSTEQEIGLPSAWFGRWQGTDEYGPFSVMITAFQYIDLADPTNAAGFVEIETVELGVKYNVIYSLLVWTQEPGQDGQPPPPPYLSMIFIKTTAEASGENVIIKIHSPSADEDFSVTVNYDMTKTDPAYIQTLTLSRPN